MFAIEKLIGLDRDHSRNSNSAPSNQEPTFDSNNDETPQPTGEVGVPPPSTAVPDPFASQMWLPAQPCWASYLALHAPPLISMPPQWWLLRGNGTDFMGMTAGGKAVYFIISFVFDQAAKFRFSDSCW